MQLKVCSSSRIREWSDNLSSSIFFFFWMDIFDDTQHCVLLCLFARRTLSLTEMYGDYRYRWAADLRSHSAFKLNFVAISSVSCRRGFLRDDRRKVDQIKSVVISLTRFRSDHLICIPFKCTFWNWISFRKFDISIELLSFPAKGQFECDECNGNGETCIRQSTSENWRCRKI